ncbi:conjugal transfer protein TraG N-terminal domain-containing protein [Fastidiosibacter lacustris]|uniref:conjugal transfer protein TraG N-terminal domain-containing protein n=1 Tax=Fastidiosibacter lacustris TaxID=2056695 RepID=UPI000E34AF8E|nr:conjugal transfer protein TraG N-terminal domain-containing protein [Fastidiosibacter lacustris]
MLDIWVTSQSGVMKTVLDGIAAFFNQNGGELLLYLVTAVGFLVVLLKYLEKPDVKQALTWFIIVAVIPVTLINPREKVTIHDTTSTLEQHAVDNVPLGLAYPLSIITSVMYSVTKTLEDAMHVPTDIAYATTGMIYASKLFKEMKSVQPDPDLMSQWSQFIYMCIDPNVRVRHRYTYKQLFDAPDMMSFLKSNTKDGSNHIYVPKVKKATSTTSPNDIFAPKDETSSTNPKDDWVGCKTALTRLEEAYKHSMAWNFKTMGALDPLDKVKDATAIEKDIQGVYGYFYKLSGTSQEMMMQNLMINATKNGLSNIAAQKNQMAAGLNYAQTQNEMNSTSTWATIGMMAQEYTPMVQTILLMLMCCAFIPMIYIAMFPTFTYSVLSKYIGSLLWITSWGVFYVFINFIMTAFMKYRLNAFTDIYGGITMSNIDAVASLTSRYVTLTGSFLIFTPYLARLVVLGAANTISGLVTSISSGITSNAQASARGVATGDYNLFSTNVANHSANNASFNKHNFDREDRFGNESRSNLQGGIESVDAMGNRYRDNRVSNLATQISKNEAITAGLNEGFNSHLSNAYSESQQAQQSWNTTLSRLASVNDNEVMRQSRQASQGNTENMSTDQAYANMVDYAHRFGKDEIKSFINGIALQEGGSVSFGGKIPFTKIGAEGHASLNFNQSWSNATNNTSSMSAADQETFRKSYNKLIQASQSEIASVESHFGVDKSNSIQSSLTETETHSQNAANEYRLAMDYQKAANYAETNGSSVNYNDIPQFESWLNKKVGSDQASYYLNSPQQQGSAEFKNLVHNYQQDSADQFKQEFLANKAQIESSTGAQIQHNSDVKVAGLSDINSAYQTNNNKVANQYGQSKSGFENCVNDMDQNVANKAVRETLGQYGLKGNTFSADNPSSFNRQMVIPPKMNISVDAQGQDLRSRADALKSEVMNNKMTNLERAKRDPNIKNNPMMPIWLQ